MKQLLTSFLLFTLFIPAYTQKQKSAGMQWFNEPKKWSVENNKISITSDPKTDFWRTTHYGYVTDNGHFYYQEVDGDFEITVKVSGSYKDLYDQAGLMIRTDSLHWIKSGIEFVHGTLNISAVVTHTWSDWSIISRKDKPTAIWLKLVRKNDSAELSYSVNGKDYEMQRLAWFPPGVKVQAGIMAAAPEGKGFTSVFENLEVQSLQDSGQK